MAQAMEQRTTLTGKITKPLRHNGVPYNGINILMALGCRRGSAVISRRSG